MMTLLLSFIVQQHTESALSRGSIIIQYLKVPTAAPK
jgi:hypothetical protein